MKVTKIDTGSTSFSVHQLWIADTQEALDAEWAEQEKRYHPSGYGTRRSGVRQVTKDSDPTVRNYQGKWVCNFYRGTSCD